MLRPTHIPIMTDQTPATTENHKPNSGKPIRAWVFDVLLIYVLLAGAYFRFVGIDWGEYQYLHPDERFLVWVGSDITPLKCLDPSLSEYSCPPEQKTWISLQDYFDAANSTLNPNNRGHGFYVYGTLPMFLTRFAVEWIYGHSGFNEMTNVGRPLSALADLVGVLLVYLIARRVYDRRVGILGAAFSAAAVLQIQQSHFFTMDTFVNLFTYLAIYFAVRVASDNAEAEFARESEVQLNTPAESEDGVARPASGQNLRRAIIDFVKNPQFALSLAFGVALGCAVASKLNAAPVAIMLPAAFGLRLLSAPTGERGSRLKWAFAYLVLAALTSLLVLRLFQPYVFSGPGFFGLKPNPQWVANIREQRVQAAGDVDFPPALQWARRPIWFSFENMVVWGLGLPLGVLAWAGFVWVGWRMLADKSRRKPEFHQHILLWGWTALYFTWQSLQFNPTMRYQLPIYPALTIFAAWGVVKLFDRGRAMTGESRAAGTSGLLLRALAILVGGAVLLATFAWAYAFTRIYARPITRVEASRWIFQNIPGPLNLKIQTADGVISQPLPVPNDYSLQTGQPYIANFTPQVDGSLSGVYIPHLIDTREAPSIMELSIEIGLPGDEMPLAAARLTTNPNAMRAPAGESFELTLDRPVSVIAGTQYQIKLDLVGGTGEIALAGSALANEGDWDDGLPVRVDGYDGFGGIYQPGLNFNMYTDDNPEKLERFLSILDQADYLLISSNRQWGSLPRLPERFPMTTLYYRNLLGCPPERTIDWCYSVASPGMFQGNMGFELVKIFQSDPTVGSFRINDQFAEEAFTVYDHPKVFIFQKSPDFDLSQAQAILGHVDFSQVVRVTPKRADNHPANLMLPVDRWAEQQAGGTWADLFDSQALLNRFHFLGVVAWYLAVSMLGLLVYPLLRLALPGLADRGYPMARLAGLLTLSYLVWVAGSARIPFSRMTITLAIFFIGLISILAAYRQRDELRLELRQNGKYFLVIELLFLAFFAGDLLIRFGNPDLWHPWKGGEKPMDFAYFNAILKSTTFPPYDPWYAGGYLNYYYYGFLLVGVLVKWLGIVPAVAYNLIIPTLFSMIAIGAFSLGWNLTRALGSGAGESGRSNEQMGEQNSINPYWVGLAAALGMGVLGNLGMVRMIFQGYQRLVAPGGVLDDAGLLTRWGWALQGFIRALGGAQLPYSIGDWYWIPSRAIPALNDVEPITEFPFFTVLYADLHAHLVALPIALLVLAFALSVVLSRGRWKNPAGALAGFFLGGMAIGALRPTNTWDFYPYLALGCVALAYVMLVYVRPAAEGLSRRGTWLAVWSGLPLASRKLLIAAGSILLLVGLSLVLFQPYAQWYGLGYGKISLWKGTHTPVSAYLTHWGLFLFVIVAWMSWETREWMATTPVSALRKLEPFKGLIQLLLFLMLLAIGLLLFTEIQIAWMVLPLAAWAGVLLLRPGISDAKRFVLFLTGTGLTLTLMVEIIVLVGDIGRMNTVFKFYLQAWTFFAVSAAAALGWLWPALSRWQPRLRAGWQMLLAALVMAAALYPLFGGMAKVKDRIDPRAPHTLDGMAFMEYATYNDSWGAMDLSQDYRAMRWMQENVVGSPVIVEANLRNLYHWGSRFSIYTGLPGVVGWEWHQQQQRAILPGNWVSERIVEIDNFYLTTDMQRARDFLNKYDVRYIILGQQERGHYTDPLLLEQREYTSSEGLLKFDRENGSLWSEVYRDADTVIYQVSDN